MVKMGATNLKRVTYLVFDEADRMFNMGFGEFMQIYVQRVAYFTEPQVRSISKHVRPDRQCSLFSATFKKKVEHLARDALQDAVRIVQGEVGEVGVEPVTDALTAELCRRTRTLHKRFIFVAIRRPSLAGLCTDWSTCARRARCSFSSPRRYGD